MHYKLLVALSLLSFNAYGQKITLDELIYIQTNKNALLTDSLLSAKKNWNCLCHREFDHLKLNTLWVYALDNLENYHDGLDRIEILPKTSEFSSVTKYFTQDSVSFKNIMKELINRKYREEGIIHWKNDTIDVRLSFHLTPNITIEVMTGRYKIKDVNDKFTFFLIDRKDYLKGLKIK